MISLCKIGPKQFSEEHKYNPKEPSVSAYWTTVLMKRIVTVDEMWIHQFELENKRQSMDCEIPRISSQKKFKRQPCAGKVMLTVFWDSQGPILIGVGLNSK